MFKNALVCIPCRNISKGISSVGLGFPDYRIALKQHQQYIAALEKCGVRVHALPPEEQYPDSTFIEDTAVLTEKCAVICRPGVSSRRGEEQKIIPALGEFYEKPEFIVHPGTLEGGDVLRIGDHFFVGLSSRTNRQGFIQLERILKKYGFTASPIKLQAALHLKTGLAYLENGEILVTGEFREKEEFKKFKRIEIGEEESYSANSIWVNGWVIMPEGYPRTREKVEQAGYPVKSVEVSEFRKLDGGVSCLSLRF